jgi:Raf kinase inhibitor-like YbhB/YbcL family protein
MGARRRAIGLLASGVVGAGWLLACGTNPSRVESADLGKGAAMAFTLKSSHLQPGEMIPRQYTCDGADKSLPLRWDEAPAGTRSFSLVAEDPDAPGGMFIHWVIYDLPPTDRELPEDLPKDRELSNGARQGRNGFGKIGYGGPCPPPGPAHHYHFRLFALDTRTKLPAGASRADLERAIQGHILAQAELMGRYKR